VTNIQRIFKIDAKMLSKKTKIKEKRPDRELSPDMPRALDYTIPREL